MALSPTQNESSSLRQGKSGLDGVVVVLDVLTFFLTRTGVRRLSGRCLNKREKPLLAVSHELIESI